MSWDEKEIKRKNMKEKAELDFRHEVVLVTEIQTRFHLFYHHSLFSEESLTRVIWGTSSEGIFDISEME